MAYRSDYEERYYDDRRNVRVADRERQSDRLDFLDVRPPEAGALVLRQRDVEAREISRPRFRSPSPAHHDHMTMVRRARSLTPPHVHDERERERIRIANRERVRYERSPSPVRYERRRSPSVDRERERIKIIQRERERDRVPERAPSPRPPSPPPVVRGPTIEREVITHYRGIDHGVIRVPSPQPPPRPAPRPIGRTEERELEIDIATSRRGTNVGVRESSRRRERSVERRSPQYGHGSELVLSSDRDRLRVEDRHWHSHGRRRAHSAAPLRSPVDEEAEYITSKIDARGRMGEAWNGATKDWTIVDVPPGTERVRMDGVGGGAAEVTWQRYNGVRRSKFIPERDGALVPMPAPAPVPRDRGRGYDRELEIEISRDRRRGSSRAPPPKRDEMWTEITKDLVNRQALMECGYEFEETEFFFYVMQYLKYDNVLELIQITEEIRRQRYDRKKWDHEYHDHRHYGRPGSKYGERVTEREVLYDNTRMRRV